MTQTRRKRVFISYRSTDRAAVDALLADLTSSGEFEIWIDRQGIKGGQAWWDAILDAIARSDVIIAALSPGALTSDACQKERAYALALGLPLIPVRIDPTLDLGALPPEIASRQVLSYSGGKREYDLLVEALRAVGYSPGTPSPAPQRPAPPAQAPPPKSDTSPSWRQIALMGLVAVVIAAILVPLLPDGAFQQAGNVLESSPVPSAAPAATSAPTAISTMTPAIAASNTPQPPSVTTASPSDAGAGDAGAGGTLPAALIYEGDTALTFLLTDSAAIGAVIVRATDSEVVLNDDFPFVVEEAARLGAGLCLRYVRASGDLPPLPNDCNPDRVFTRRLADADVFWWDDAQNAARTLAVLNGGTRIALCSSVPARCDLDGG